MKGMLKKDMIITIFLILMGVLLFFLIFPRLFSVDIMSYLPA